MTKPLTFGRRQATLVMSNDIKNPEHPLNLKNKASNSSISKFDLDDTGGGGSE